MPLTPPIFRFKGFNPVFFRLNTVNAANFPVQRRQLRCFSGPISLIPLFFQFNGVDATIFPLNAVNELFFRFNAVNAAIFPVQWR